MPRHPKGRQRQHFSDCSSGFSALPAGNYNGSYNNFGNNANFWSATENNDNNAYNRKLNYNNANVNRNNNNKNNGFSVRCLRDMRDYDNCFFVRQGCEFQSCFFFI